MAAKFWDGHGVAPGKIICLGRNYVAHINELNNDTPDAMMFFMKPSSAANAVLNASHQGEDVHFEAELCFSVENQKITGVGFGLDLTKRTAQSALKKAGLPWERAKAFTASAVFSGFVSAPDDLTSLSFELEVDGKIVQAADYELMIYKPADIVVEADEAFGLLDGDILMTGTPEGVGALRAGSHYVGRIFVAGDIVVEASWTAE